MFLYFDKYYRLKEIVQDENFVQGGYNNNQLFVYIEGEPYFTNATIRYELHGVSIDDRNTPMTTDEYEFNKMSGKMQIPFNRNRDLKYFSYHNSYDFLVFNLTDTENNLYNILAVDGLVLAMIRLYDSDTNKIQPLGVITFKVEKGIVAKDSCITSSQFDTLMLNIASKQEILKSGENIKTIEGQDILGSGDIKLDNKLDKDSTVSTNPKVYFKEANGNNVTKNTTPSLTAWSIPYRDDTINFKVGNITESSDGNYIANKNYVDDVNIKQSRRIEQLEKASEGTILETVENEVETSYIREIEENTLPYTLLETLGGMTYKNENLLSSENKVVNGTWNGITYTFENGCLVLNGTPTSIGFFIISEAFGNELVVDSSKMSLQWFTENAPTGNYSIGLRSYYYNYYNGSNGSVTISNGENTSKNISVNIGSTDITFTNAKFKPMIVSGTTAPTEFSQGFIGLRNSPVTEVVSKGANLQPREWSDLNDRIELNTTLKKGQSYTLCVNLPPTKGSRGLNLYDDKNNVLFSNEMTGWTDPKSGWNSFVITAVTDTTSLRINAYGFEKTSMQGAIFSGALVDKNKYNAINIYKPYTAPTVKTIPTAITSIDGYGLGVNETYYNYIDFERKVFVQNVYSVYLKDLSWSKSSNTTFDRFICYLQKSAKSRTNIVSDISLNDTSGKGDIDKNNSVIVINSATQIVVNVSDYGVTTLDNFVAMLNEKNPILIYQLETPIETDISDLLSTFDNTMKVEGLGTITFENEHKQKIPNGITYQRRI